MFLEFCTIWLSIGAESDVWFAFRTLHQNGGYVEYSRCSDIILRQVIMFSDVLFQKRVRGFHQVSKHGKTLETTRPQAEWFYCFRVFENLLKPEARVFEITSPTKELEAVVILMSFLKYSFCRS